MFIFSLSIFVACIKDYENPNFKSPVHESHVHGVDSSETSDGCTNGCSTAGSSSGGNSSGGNSGGTTTGSSSGGNSSGGNSGGEDGLQCNEELAEYPNVSECYTDEIQDGDVLELTLVGGTTHFNSSIYNTSGWYCEPMSTNTYEGSERAFHFQHPGGYQNCVITLESNCGDLSLGALVWDVNTQGCPVQGSYVPACEWSNDVDSGNEDLILYEYHPTNYLIIVDAKQPVDANFSLSVSCSLF